MILVLGCLLFFFIYFLILKKEKKKKKEVLSNKAIRIGIGTLNFIIRLLFNYIKHHVYHKSLDLIEFSQLCKDYSFE